MENITSKFDDKLEMSNEICRHAVYSNGVETVKEVRMILIDGEHVCPLCRREEANKRFEDEVQKEVDELKAKRKYRIFESQSVITDIDLLNAGFGNYETTGSEERTNKERATKAYQEYRKGEVFNTWLTGLPGTGKSHLAMSILRNLNEVEPQDKSCVFVSVDTMLMRIRESFDNKDSEYTESYFVDLLTSVDYLVLDDLGAETGGTGTDKRATDFTLRVLYAIANGRRNKSTIITTNLGKKELIKMYDPKLISRLMGTVYQIKFEQASDKRVKVLKF